MPVQERHLRAVFDGTTWFVVVLRPDGVVVEANRTALRTLGVASDDVIGHPLVIARWWTRPSEALPRLRQALASAATGSSVRCRVELAARSRSVQLDLTVRPILGADGRVDLLIAEGHDVGDLVVHERTRRDSSDLLHGLLENSSDLVAALDLDFHFLVFNRAYREEFERLYGVRLVEGMRLHDALADAPIDRERLVALWSRALRGDTFTVIEELGSSARSREAFELRFSQIIGRGGRFFGAAHIVRSVSESVRVQHTLERLAADLETRVQARTHDLEQLDHALRRQIEGRHRAESRLALQADMLDHIEDAIVAWDASRRVVALNAAATARFGIPAALARGRMIDDVVTWHPIDPDDDATSIEEAVRTLGRWEGLVCQDLPDGREATSELVVRRLDGEDVHDGRLAVFRDVTTLRETEEALRRSEARFRQALEAADGILYEIDAEGRLVSAPDIERLLGDRPSRHGGRPTWSHRIHPEDRSRVDAAHADAVAERRPWRIAYRLAHAGGRWIDVEEHGTVVLDRDGRVERRLGIVMDVSGRREAERALRQSKEQLAELASSLEQRVRDRTAQVRELSAALTLAEQRERRRLSQVLHDGLQQILFSLGMRLQVARKQAGLVGDDDPASQALRHCQELVRRAIGITRSIAVELNPPTLRGQQIAPSLQWLAKHLHEVHGLEVHLDVADDVIVPGSDQRALVVQLVRELLVNVARHAGVGSAEVHASTEHGELVIDVVDEGRGFDADEALRREQPRDALGLFSVEQRLRLFGGSLTIRSAPGEGAAIRIRMPVGEADPADHVRPA